MANEKEIYKFIKQSGTHGRQGYEIINYAQQLGEKTRELDKILVRLEHHGYLVSEDDKRKIYSHSLDCFDFV
jgi:DNA-binding PadR family transcriptional regulator